MAQIPIPDTSTLRELLDYDPMTGKLYWKYREENSSWNTRYAYREAFAYVGNNGYYIGSLYNSIFLAHHIIYKWYHGIDANNIDHINGNTLDNSIQNLRSVTHQENMKNIKKSIKNTSGQTGVSWNKKTQKWRARIQVQKKEILLGFFSDYTDAVNTRKQAEIRYGFHPNHGR